MAQKKTSNETDEARLVALEKALGDITKRYGDGAIMRLGESHQLNVEVIPTGSLSLDIALGVGGIPRGRITEIYGPESSGKTTISQHIVAEAQKLGGTCAFIDMEHALDPAYAHRCGVDVERLLISQPDMGEQALEITEALVRSGAVDVIVIDSVAALVPRAEIEGDMGDSPMGMQARLMSQALRKLSDVRKPGDDHRWHGAEILRLGASGCAQNPIDQAGLGDHRKSHTSPSCEKQGSRSLPHSGIRHHVQRGDIQGG
jgi:recombination protein RecA